MPPSSCGGGSRKKWVALYVYLGGWMGGFGDITPVISFQFVDSLLMDVLLMRHIGNFSAVTGHPGLYFNDDSFAVIELQTISILEVLNKSLPPILLEHNRYWRCSLLTSLYIYRVWGPSLHLGGDKNQTPLPCVQEIQKNMDPSL